MVHSAARAAHWLPGETLSPNLPAHLGGVELHSHIVFGVLPLRQDSIGRAAWLLSRNPAFLLGHAHAYH